MSSNSMSLEAALGGGAAEAFAGGGAGAEPESSPKSSKSMLGAGAGAAAGAAAGAGAGAAAFWAAGAAGAAGAAAGGAGGAPPPTVIPPPKVGFGAVALGPEAATPPKRAAAIFCLSVNSGGSAAAGFAASFGAKGEGVDEGSVAAGSAPLPKPSMKVGAGSGFFSFSPVLKPAGPHFLGPDTFKPDSGSFTAAGSPPQGLSSDPPPEGAVG